MTTQGSITSFNMLALVTQLLSSDSANDSENHHYYMFYSGKGKISCTMLSNLLTDR